MSTTQRARLVLALGLLNLVLAAAALAVTASFPLVPGAAPGSPGASGSPMTALGSPTPSPGATGGAPGSSGTPAASPSVSPVKGASPSVSPAPGTSPATTAPGTLSPTTAPSAATPYAFVTLRPPQPSRRQDPACAPNCDANEQDVFLDGVNTKLTVRGNLGTNTNLILTACPISQPCTDATTSVVLDAGSFANRYDAYKAWGGVPLDRQMSSPVQDPGYPFPTSPDPNDARWNFSSEPAARMTSADCTTQVGKIPSAYRVDAAGIDTGAVICYRPGAYDFRLTSPAHVTTMVFSPGVYFLNGGFQVGNNVKVIGGYDPGQSGVAFVFPRTCNPACTFAGNSADLIALNAGSAYPSGSGTYATAASNWNGVLVQTTGRNPLPMTLLVRPDADCVVGPADAPACQHDEGQNRQLRLPGSGSIFVIGVQYAPTDNVAITGGSGSNGYLGQVWAWTVQYTGGSNIYLSER